MGFVATSCARSPEPVIYALAPRAAAGVPSEPCKVELRRPGLSRYLDRPQIVRRATSERLVVDGLERWAAPLETLVSTTLVEDLSRRLPSCTVYAEGGSISLAPDVWVELELQRFELNENGVVELFAQVALVWPNIEGTTSLRRHALTTSPANRDAPAVVASLSELLGQLSDQIAGAILSPAPGRRSEIREPTTSK
jgi:uncharacterized lipoprotein YmbA